MTSATTRTLLALTCATLPWTVATAAQPAQPARVPDTVTVRDVGDGGRTWVLITGVVGGVAGYAPLEQRLVAAGHRVIVIDGYRLSLDAADVSFTAVARRVDRELRRRGIGYAHVVGHAHGAGVALRLAAYSPERVADLTFLDAGALIVEPSGILNASLRMAQLMAHLPGGKSLLRAKLEKGLRENSGRDAWLADEATRRTYTEPLLCDVGRTIGMALKVANGREPEPVPDVVARVRTAVTLVLGTVPHASGPTQEEFDLLVPLGARLRVEKIAGVGHFVHEEAPDELASILLRQRVASSPSRR
jgi:pimeloyl-ACP methyl ester carboxylesterase